MVQQNSLTIKTCRPGNSVRVGITLRNSEDDVAEDSTSFGDELPATVAASLDDQLEAALAASLHNTTSTTPTCKTQDELKTEALEAEAQRLQVPLEYFHYLRHINPTRHLAQSVCVSQTQIMYLHLTGVGDGGCSE